MSNTQQPQKLPTGTAWIVWGFILAAWAAFVLIRTPFTLIGADASELIGGIIGLALIAGCATACLVRGFSRRKRYLARGAAVTAPPTVLPPAGWFPDASAPGQLRWWDGYRWTEHTSTINPTSVQQPPVA